MIDRPFLLRCIGVGYIPFFIKVTRIDLHLKAFMGWDIS